MLVYEKQSVPQPNHPYVMEASTSSCKRKSSEPITGIPNKMAPVQEQEEEDSYPDLPSPGYVPLRRAAADKDQNPGGQVSENLALEEENVECDLCQEEVEEGDKYRLHLVDKHNVTMEEVEAMADAAMSS